LTRTAPGNLDSRIPGPGAGPGAVRSGTVPAVEERHVRPFELARPWDLAPEVSPIINLNHSTKIDTIAEAMTAMRCELDLIVR